jgi:hypothetical protein
MFIAKNSVAGSRRRIKKLEEASKVKRFLSRRLQKEGHYSSRPFLYTDCIKHKDVCSAKIYHTICVCVSLVPVPLLPYALNFDLRAIKNVKLGDYSKFNKVHSKLNKESDFCHNTYLNLCGLHNCLIINLSVCGAVRGRGKCPEQKMINRKA